MHPGDRVDPRLRCVPWLNVSNNHLRGKPVPESRITTKDYNESNATSKEVMSRLADLGYT